jgi:hypothetical protein
VPGPVFIFCAPGVVSCGTEGVRSRFHILRSRTLFRRYRGRQVPFLCFACPDSYSAVPRASALIFIFCASGLFFGGTECVRSLFHVLHSHTCFHRCRVHRVTFSCFPRLGSFSAVPMATGPVFKFCAPGLVFGGTVGVVSCGTAGIRSRFHDLCSRTRFRQY